MSADGGRSPAAEAVQQVKAAAEAVVGDMAEGRWRRAGVVGLSLGVVAAGAAAGVAVERLTVGREVRRRARAEVDAAAPFGSLHGIPYPVAAPDGTELYVELDGAGWAGTPFAKVRPGPQPTPTAEPAPEPVVPDPADAAPDAAGPESAPRAGAGSGGCCPPSRPPPWPAPASSARR